MSICVCPSFESFLPRLFKISQKITGYGIATPKGSKWRDKISLAILELQEKGVIQILYDKWWKNTGDVCNRDDKSKDSKANALGVENIGKNLLLKNVFFKHNFHFIFNSFFVVF